MMELLAGIVVEGVACAGDQGLLQHARVSAARGTKVREDLAGLPPPPSLAGKIDLSERCVYLDCVGIVAREGLRAMTRLNSMVRWADGEESKDAEPAKPGGGPPDYMVRSLCDSVARGMVDWDQVLRAGSPWYDRMVDGCRVPARAGRQKGAKRNRTRRAGPCAGG